MIKRLPVLLKLNEAVFKEIELKKPSGRVISDTQEEVQRTNFLIANRNFIAGCTMRITGEEKEIVDMVAIKSALGKMSNKTIDYLSQEIMVDYFDDEDLVEGVYPCPRCGEKIINEITKNDGIVIDTRDSIKSLQVNFMDDVNELEFDIEMTKPVTIISAQNEEQVQNITMTYPTIEHYVKAHAIVSDKNLTKLQYHAFANAIIKVNGVDVDDSWRRTFGVQLFNNTTEVKKDIGRIKEIINKYGVDARLDKTCLGCGKVWRPFINTSNFFDFALQ